ncbi:MAG: Arc family DNA-binding protein [Phenylobacterium sp.]|uniref:Arc family DNA-binding protein n=1 Tax=Phenylobacterium sp. TaxID=1871053 RepID=UPI001203DB92|nr:Arc family DNA-binding protein [Phenylobacterium sp.]TAJ72811.1 MAG: Arc family DNA-binding protein [Phenylobacterium sp.]
MPLADPIQVRLERELLTEIRATAQANGRSVVDEIRHRLEHYNRADLQVQGLRSELALFWANGPRPDDRVLDGLLRLQGMVAEVLGFMRRGRPVDTEAAQRDVERHGLRVWGRAKEDR